MHILVFKYGNNKTKEVYDQEGVSKSFSSFDKHVETWVGHLNNGTVTHYKLFHYYIGDDGHPILSDSYIHPFTPSKAVRIIN